MIGCLKSEFVSLRFFIGCYSKAVKVDIYGVLLLEKNGEMILQTYSGGMLTRQTSNLRIASRMGSKSCFVEQETLH